MMHLANLITHRFIFAALFVGSAAWAACINPCVASADQPADAYQSGVRPYIEKYCGACHGDETAKGDLNLLSTTSSRDVIATFRRWNHAIEFIHSGEMPPEDSPQPSIDESNAAVAAIRAILIAEAEKQAGDPGFVPPRRLSKTEYDLSIRDLTGIDIRPTRDFPPDPAAGEGFDNTGEALGMTPNLLKKYLAAAQSVSDHLVLKTTGIDFAPFPVTSYNERTKLTEQAIIDFYQSHAIDVGTYVEAAWRYQHRPESERSQSPMQWCTKPGISGRYLALVVDTLASPAFRSGPLASLGQSWDALPPPRDATTRPQELVDLIRTIELHRQLLTAPEGELIRANAGNWPISHLDSRAKTAAARDRFDPAVLRSELFARVGRIPQQTNKPDQPNQPDNPDPQLVWHLKIDPLPGANESFVIVSRPLFSRADRPPGNDDEATRDGVVTLREALATDPELAAKLQFGKHPLRDETDPDSFVVKAPCDLTIPIPSSARGDLADKQLLASFRLDQRSHADGGASILSAIGPSAQQLDPAKAQWLVARDGNLARQIAQPAEAFCNAFPNRFFFVDPGRGLAAGFHLVEGFFRDDLPLVNKALSPQQRDELDRLWQELDFVTQSAETLLRGFVWFERSEREVLHDQRFDFLRAEDPQLVEASMLDRFEKLYLDKLGIKLVGDSLTPQTPNDQYAMVHGFFERIRQALADYQTRLAQAEPLAMPQLESFASRAFRRPLTDADRQSLDALYKRLRTDGVGVEASLRGVLTAILMSPDFLYRFQTTSAGDAVFPINDRDLASRLSYFLWSSLPDATLLDAAATGKLRSDDELRAQTRRMLQDPRVESFAREFFGQWLRYRDYLDKDPINAEAFAGYDDELRQAMFDEPTRLITDLIRTDQPIDRILDSDTTFVNRRLAAHYGDDITRRYRQQIGGEGSNSQWAKIDGLSAAGRGGILGMAVTLTKNSAGERTSPVKRGFWGVHHLLGQHFPPPPADVPELPKSETAANQTIRELLAAHVADAQCAMCHKHFDGLGLAMEGFDAIGRRRTADSAGRPIDDLAPLPGGKNARGIPGLIEYIRSHRRDDFANHLCRRFLGYALGRSVILSDQPLLDEMRRQLDANDQRFSALFETVVLSPQFRTQRGSDFTTYQKKADR